MIIPRCAGTKYYHNNVDSLKPNALIHKHHSPFNIHQQSETMRQLIQYERILRAI